MTAQRVPVVITGSGLVSALAADRHRLHAALVRGEHALAPPQRVAEGSPAPLPAGLLVGEVRDFAPEDDLGADANLRPLDRAARLLTVAASRALADCGAHLPGDRDAARSGLAVGTTYGSLSTIAEFDRRQLTAGPRYVKPLDFANTVINAAAGQAAIWLRLEGINATFAGGTPAALQALAFAADQLRAGHADLLLAGGVEELAAESILAFARTGLLAQPAGDGTAVPGSSDAFPRPFGAGRQGFALAEGAALVSLETAAHATVRGAAPLATVGGFASTFGDSDEALERAVGEALNEAGLAATDLAVWVASANGSPDLDAREARGVARALAGHQPAVLVPKAGLGDALGASGALAIAALLEVFATGVVPGLPGFAADPALPPLGLGAANRPAALTRAAAGAAPVRTGLHGLVTGLGLDGAVAALVLSQGGPR